MAFKPAKELLDMYVIQNAILSNSITVTIGDAMIINSSAPQFVTLNGTNTTDVILGTVLTINGGTAGGNAYPQVNSITTTSTNQTVAKVSVDILLSNNLTTLIADLDAATGTTTNSQYYGYFAIKSGAQGTLLESSYSAGTPKQFLSFGVNPGNSSQVIGVWSKVARI